MLRKDNDSLEDFFRKAASRPDLEFNEADWSNMEKMLDRHLDKPVAGFWTRGTIAMVAVVSALVILTVMLWPDRPDDSKTVAQQIQTVPDAGSAPSDDQRDHAAPINPNGEERSNNDTPDVTRPERSVDAGQDVGDVSSERADKSTHAQATPSGPQRKIREDAIVIREPGPQDNDGVSVEENPSPSAASVPDRQSEPESRSVTASEAIQQDVNDAAQLSAGKLEQSADSTTEVLATVVPDTAASDEATAEPKRKKAFPAGRFSVSVMAAPDFSMTTGGGALGSGDALGVMLHYQVLPRWGIAAGLVHNTKKYWGRGNEYHPPRGYWKALTNGVVPERIDGICAMYEIPVAVTFDVVQTQRSRLFASAGLSSYMMQKEDYYYRFDSPNPGSVTGWSGDKPATLWFGIGTLSLGYDFKVTRNLSFGVEPYLKIPMEGIGWADVDLYSTGVMFGARYNFATSGNKHPPPSKGP